MAGSAGSVGRSMGGPMSPNTGGAVDGARRASAIIVGAGGCGGARTRALATGGPSVEVGAAAEAELVVRLVVFAARGAHAHEITVAEGMKVRSVIT